MSQKNVLRIECEIPRIIENEIHSFLGHESRGHRKDRDARAPLQFECVLQLPAIASLPSQIFRGKVVGNLGIALRIPDALVNSIQNSHEAIA